MTGMAVKLQVQMVQHIIVNIQTIIMMVTINIIVIMEVLNPVSAPRPRFTVVVIKMLMLIHTTTIVIFFVAILAIVPLLGEMAIALLHRDSSITLAITQIPFKWRKTCCNEDISDQVVQTQIRPLPVSHLIDPTIKVIIIRQTPHVRRRAAQVRYDSRKTWRLISNLLDFVKN